ncbi:type 4 prepilin peptidase 1 Aspartic peptidase. MEROPS family A24A [Methylophilus rhizosphaerae]|uniref:Prepilin leader peptidase/N-methyltransferase n=1 Tax=Methylophilus rhizosphaerae TaxID=492660 RepID=A0A1G8ZVN8_9PROT|nr:A24 family peptidase [Methylophilus rhizosphaerae]SDK19209.1 type 4 prepilin peptidase 1 Aspartic peptidase. MEROPS family A24A [Methylophilus rhizosphaerae]
MTEILEPVLSLLKTQPYFLQGVCLVLGLLIGSFLNVVIHRLPKMMERDWQVSCLDLQGQAAPDQPRYNLVIPRSSCPSCGHAISAWENIPVISYLCLRGKCKACQAPISARYPLVELLTGGLAYSVAVQYGYSALTLFALVFVFALVALTFIDFDTQLLPDDITLPLLWLGLLVNLQAGFTDITSAVIGAMVGYLVLWSVYWLFKLVTGKEGMGYGDFKLLAAIGAWFGWQLLPAVILLSSVVGSVIGLGLILLKGKTRHTAIPFGPFLALGGIAALFYGQALAAFYLMP